MKFYPLFAALLLITVSPVADAQARDPSSIWITLGTIAGPLPDTLRSQPANALVVNANRYLVDAGDGAAGQLAKAGIRPQELSAVFLSHLHFDHTGGLPAILGLRYQLTASNMLTVYGPPGTRRTVDGIIEFMRPMTEVGYGFEDIAGPAPDVNVRVVELGDGSVIEVDGFRVTAARNSHFSFLPDSDEYERHQSLAYRFDLPDRSIVYTGDTGPSKAIEELAGDADILISEVMDFDAAIERVRKFNPHIPEKVVGELDAHMRAHHISPEQVGEMANAAGVRRVILTHVSPALHDEDEQAAFVDRVGTEFDGKVDVADDLDRF